MAEGSHNNKNQSERPKSPPDLIPPDAAQREHKKSSKAPLLVLGGGLLLLIAAVLVLILPLLQEDPATTRQVELQESRPADQSAQPQSPTVSSPAVPSLPAEQEDAVREIEGLIGTWLQKQAEAEAVNVTAWGGESYSGAVTLAKECDQLLGEKQYLPAKQACQSAIKGLDELMASQDALLEETLAAGLLALEQGNPKAAVEHFSRALAIDANEERAAAGIRRAEQLPAVLQFLEDGLALESDGDPDGALLALTEAAALDPEFLPTREALARVQATIAERAFQETMSRALQAMTEGKLSAARAALQKAESIKPGNRAVRDLRQQLEQTQLAGRLTSLRQDAARMEKEERWPEALKSCEKALSLDAHAAFAVSCKERVSARVDLDSRLKTILAKPERLFEDGPLQEARRTLNQASATSPRGPRITAQIDQLGRLITQAEAEVEVVLLSDNLTEVTIYHVGRLGRFEEKHLVLRTGNYTATGNRNGFRDVRQTLKVRPESGKMTFTLRCEEPI
jgi:tetratricopeptide (TPR) repeat protein